MYEEITVDRRTLLILQTPNGWMTKVRIIFILFCLNLVKRLQVAWAKIWKVFKKELKHVRKGDDTTWMVLFVDSHPAHIYDPEVLQNMLDNKVCLDSFEIILKHVTDIVTDCPVELHPT